MTPADILAAIDSLPLEKIQQVLVETNTMYARKLMAFRRARAAAEREVELGCDHVWEEWTSGKGNTYHHRRCVRCRKQEEVDSSD